MKKSIIVGMLMAALAMPAWAAAEVEAAAGNISLHGHIDYVYRYSEEDKDEEWPGYDTQNLESAVLGMSGQVGDNVSWIVSYAFAFAGPTAAMQSAAATDETNNMVGGSLLDARINLNLMDNMQLSFGRFIPPTSMTWCPHKMSVLHTVNYPLLHGSGVYGGNALPLPMYQTGMMLTAMVGPAKVMVGGFNGAEAVGGDDLAGGNIATLGNNNNMDIDRNKGILAKVSVDQQSMHFGGWYYAEDASVNPMRVDNAATDWKPVDGQVTRWGIEGAYSANNLLVAAEYISSTLSAEDDAIDDNLIQNGWYLTAGYTMSQVQFLVRYDDVNYDVEEDVIAGEDTNQENATTIGLNYFLNEQTTLGLNYTMRSPEDVDANTDEIAMILELDLF